jgi:excisionase family DNA binding protein
MPTRRSDLPETGKIPQLGETLSMTVKTAMKVTGLSKDGIYDLLAAGEINGFLMGSRRYIDATSLRNYIARRAAEPLSIRRSPKPRQRWRWIGPADQPTAKP